MTTSLWLGLFVSVAFLLFYQRASLSVWTISISILLSFQTYFGQTSIFGLIIVWAVFLVLAVLLNIRSLRRRLITSHILPIYRRMMPSMSRTEQEALAAGTVGFEAELFRGEPDWQALLATPAPVLTEEEQAFLDGPVETLCRMTNDWECTFQRADLSPETWQFLKTHGFFGLIIPKNYGGKAFSALAHSAILLKTYACSPTLATTITVPNSLGPAELLLHYGTEEQKDYYLPRLARGEEIPCFALTGPEAGSDAGSIPDKGIVCRAMWEGKEILGIRLNWDKRYITLAPVATVLGLAFKLYDPEHLLSDEEERGITCALIPVQTPGITIGRRHLPLYTPFQNGPTQGKDVFIPMDWIIGGVPMVGHGWQMLVECLSAGRAISLPSSVIGGAKAMALATGAYARIRKQFNMPIGEFEGIQEALARMAGYTYLIDAARIMTIGTVDRGEKPSVASAILKYHATEFGRQVVQDAMDVHGGKAICLGDRNYIAPLYLSAPISITVEGANILTRNMIIFGQGAIRCHPYVLSEMEAAQDIQLARSLNKFDHALFGHIGYTTSNIVRTLALALTSGYISRAPKTTTRRYYQQLTRFSAAFALISDVCMLLLGGKLKRKERLSARLGDILSLLYLTSAGLKHYEDQGRPIEDLPLLQWTCQRSLFMIQEKLDGILKNLPNGWVAAVLRVLIFPWGRRHFVSPDHLDAKVAQILMKPSATRDRLTQGLYLTPDVGNRIGIMEQTLREIIAAEPLEKRLQQALRERGIRAFNLQERIEAGLNAGLIDHQEADQLLQMDLARKAVIAVDDFDPKELSKIR
jgi:acyl-CoA dehydrogenase